MPILRTLGYLWAAPQTLLGLLFALWYRPTGWRWSEGCLEAIGGTTADHRTRIIGQPQAQTWGWVIYYARPHDMELASIRVHERVHVIQAFIGGPVYILSYVLHWFWLMAFTPADPAGQPRWRRAYYHIWAEAQAYKMQGEYDAGLRPGAWGSHPTLTP